MPAPDERKTPPEDEFVTTLVLEDEETAKRRAAKPRVPPRVQNMRFICAVFWVFVLLAVLVMLDASVRFANIGEMLTDKPTPAEQARRDVIEAVSTGIVLVNIPVNLLTAFVIWQPTRKWSKELRDMIVISAVAAAAAAALLIIW